MMSKTPWSNRVLDLYKIWTKPKKIPRYRVKMIDIISNEMRSNPTWTLLDAGCGNGLLFKYLPDSLKERYTGIDFTPEMIEYCREKHSNYSDKFHVADIRHIDQIYEALGLHSVDIVVTQNVLQHILEFQFALRNLVILCNKTIILCERTQKKNTQIVGYNPVRWRFRDEDFINILRFYAELFSFYSPTIIGRPRSTQNIKNVLAVYKMNSRTYLTQLT